MSHSKAAPAWDTRLFKIEPWNGITSEWFVRVHVSDVEGYLLSQGDEYASWHDHCITQTDPGGLYGPVIGPPMTAAEQRKQNSARAIRRRMTFSFYHPRSTCDLFPTLDSCPRQQAEGVAHLVGA